MNIEIHDATLESRIREQLRATGAENIEELLLRLLDTQEQQDRWLMENRSAIDAQIKQGLAQLDRGEGIPEESLRPHLEKLKAQK